MKNSTGMSVLLEFSCAEKTVLAKKTAVSLISQKTSSKIFAKTGPEHLAKTRTYTDIYVVTTHVSPFILTIGNFLFIKNRTTTTICCAVAKKGDTNVFHLYPNVKVGGRVSSG